MSPNYAISHGTSDAHDFPGNAELDVIRRDIILAFDAATSHNMDQRHHNQAIMRLEQGASGIISGVMKDDFGIAFPDVFLKAAKELLDTDRCLTGREVVKRFRILKSNMNSEKLANLRAELKL